MKKNFRLFFDMDDTLVDFSIPNWMDEINNDGFFASLNPLPFLSEVNKLAAMCPENVYVLSACINNKYCRRDKILWLKKYLPAAMKEHVFFSKNGKSKPNYVRYRLKKIDKYDILIDDYGKNIQEWENAGGTAIKFKNGHNASHPEKYKYIIGDFSELMDTIVKIREEIEKEETKK